MDSGSAAPQFGHWRIPTGFSWLQKGQRGMGSLRLIGDRLPGRLVPGRCNRPNPDSPILRREWTFDSRVLMGIAHRLGEHRTHARQFQHHSPRKPESRKIVVGGFHLIDLETI